MTSFPKNIPERIKITRSEYDKFTEEQKQLYNFAVNHIDDDWAYGPYGGWARAHETLIKLGWTEKKRSEGHRTFVSLVKPDLK